MRPTNERWCYSVIPYLIGWVHMQWSLVLWLNTFSLEQSDWHLQRHFLSAKFTWVLFLRVNWQWHAFVQIIAWCLMLNMQHSVLSGLNELTHWGQDQMDAIVQMTPSNALLWTKRCLFNNCDRNFPVITKISCVAIAHVRVFFLFLWLGLVELLHVDGLA